MQNLFLVSLGLCSLLNLAGAEGVRKWTSQDGRSIIAELKKVEGPHATLLKEGKSYQLAIETLSSEDQDYLKQWVIKNRETVADTPNEEGLKISKKGKLLYETNFKNYDGWRVSSGQWTCEDSTVIATQTTSKGHKGHMVIKRPKPVNVIIECEILLLEGGSIGFTIDDAPNKLGVISFHAGGFGAQATHRVKKPAIKKRFNGVKTPLPKDEWHHVTIEMIGNKISINCEGHQSSSTDDIWAGKPKRLGLRVAGGPSKYRNLKMWEALPKE